MCGSLMPRTVLGKSMTASGEPPMGEQLGLRFRIMALQIAASAATAEATAVAAYSRAFTIWKSRPYRIQQEPEPTFTPVLSIFTNATSRAERVPAPPLIA